MEFENGIMAEVSGAQYVKYGYDARAEILGTDGIVKIGTQHSDSVEVSTKSQENISQSLPSWQVLFLDAYTAEDNSFVQSIQNHTEPEVTGYDGKMSLRLVNAGFKSLMEHRIVEL